MENVSKSKPTNKKTSEQRSLRLPIDWWEHIEEKALQDRRSVNNYLEIVIGEAIGKLPKNKN